MKIALHIGAQFVSLVMHPVFVLTYGLMLFMLLAPDAFGDLAACVRPDQETCVRWYQVLTLRTFVQTAVLPLVAVVLMRFLGFVESLEMPERNDRIGPLIVMIVFVLWMYMNYKQLPDIPDLYISMILGSIVALFVTFFVNVFSKISLHAVGMGGLIGMIAILLIRPFDYFSEPDIQTIYMVLGGLIVLAGVVGTARLLLDAHKPVDLWGGYALGFGAQFVAVQFVVPA